MNLRSLWRSLRGQRAAVVASSPTQISRNSGSPAPAGGDLLAQARALVREGRDAEASDLYWKLKQKQQSVESLVEHAELLLRTGDFFSAASKAGRACELEPSNARARAVQEEIVRREEAEAAAERKRKK